MGRNDEFSQGQRRPDDLVDLYHGTTQENADSIREYGFTSSYAENLHFYGKPEPARDYGDAVVHFRAPRSEVWNAPDPEVGDLWGVEPREGEDDEPEEMPGFLPSDYVHCTDGATCIRRRR